MARPKKQVVVKQPTVADEMNAHAMRIWNGQSVSLSIPERVRRVVAGLIGQGHESTMQYLQLPVEGGFERYL